MPRAKPKPHDPMAFGYGRVSTHRQELSIEVQRQQTHQYYLWKLSHDKVGWAEWYCDPAVSGKLSFREREAGFALSQRVQSGDHIIFAKLDRAFRNARDALECLDSWKDRGIHVHFLDIGANTSTPFGHMMVQMLAVFAEWEREKIRERTREAFAELKRRGLPTTNAPLGFDLQGKTVKKGGKGRTLVVNEDEMLVMKRVAQLRQNGETFDRIAEKFTEANIPKRPTRGGKLKRVHTWRYGDVWFYNSSYHKLLKQGRLPSFALLEESRSAPTGANTPSEPTP